MNSVQCYVWLGLALLGGAALLRWYFYWKSHAVKFKQSGYMAPYTTACGKIFFNLSTRLLTFLTVGPVKTVDRRKSPMRGRTVYVGNHQLPTDFAMLRRGAGRHFRTLTSAKELKGFFGVLGAWSGVISIAFKEKSERAAAEAACVDTVTKEDGALGIFPEGNLLPDNPELNERWLPGAIRIARKASANAGAPVNIVPIAIYYEQDPARASWSQRFLSRSKWLGKRDPRNWDPVFKLDLDTLGSDEERERVTQERAEKLKAYYHSHITLYGGVVVVGDPIEVSTLPADENDACLVLRDRVHDLLQVAKKHS